MAAEPDPQPGPDAGIEELQADIERTRGELGDTVAALSDKMDVKTRTQNRIHEVADNAKAEPAVPVAAVLAAAAAVGLLVWLRRRRSR
ncbi:DUF3618 domain-containing protein [Mycolicibacterium sp. OfavD-34-C]|uniref:DUF3618 domain-containing protein n=1 Tax=Mycolicibacterium sp. OfavD-34-C TaxID=2917746 RepID=UPI0012678C50|nr:DUF3618 domain-containing protein [Mycolicibacterium sp. OfavD-34-C]MCG7582419.1 DUF3618 domain-containing protein [Mycolicibacterium sp. OfavD-34-C]QFS89421.1 hypothetical protein FIV07_01620 [Mycobacterium sp. THAF192]